MIWVIIIERAVGMYFTWKYYDKTAQEWLVDNVNEYVYGNTDWIIMEDDE